jgi:dsRNA-specific ribonuclease
MYTDSGIDPVRRFVLDPLWRPSMRIAEDDGLVVDYKSALQEAAISRGLPVPRYVLVRETGPEHRKTFTVEARVGPMFAERAEGSSKSGGSARRPAGAGVIQQAIAMVIWASASSAVEPPKAGMASLLSPLCRSRR